MTPNTPDPWAPEPARSPEPAASFPTIEQFAYRLQVSVSTARRRVKDGSVRVVRIGRLLRVDPAEIARLAEAEAQDAIGGYSNNSR